MDTETLIAHHVEALIGLGWRWEGRGLVPTLRGKNMPAFNSQKLSAESINRPLEKNQ
jgi:hypothetical protein